MDMAGKSHERGGRSGVAGRLDGARDRRRPRASTVRAESAHLDGGQSSAAAADQPIDDIDPAVAAADTADQLQADYFRRLLTQSRLLLGRRIDDNRKAIAAAEANGDGEAVRTLRRVAWADEKERRALDEMIEKLRHRFPRRTTPARVPANSPQPRFAAR